MSNKLRNATQRPKVDNKVDAWKSSVRLSGIPFLADSQLEMAISRKAAACQTSSQRNVIEFLLTLQLNSASMDG